MKELCIPDSGKLQKFQSGQIKLQKQLPLHSESLCPHPSRPHLEPISGLSEKPIFVTSLLSSDTKHMRTYHTVKIIPEPEDEKLSFGELLLPHILHHMKHLEVVPLKGKKTLKSK
eukprot:bmy_10600T0